MKEHVARWEWRTFVADRLPTHLWQRFALSDELPDASDEIYIVSLTSPHNVKIRGGRLEIKLLDATDRGLERWRPTLKAPFPIDDPAFHAAFDAWGIPAPVLMPRHASQDEFLGQVVAPVESLRVVRLRKRRKRTIIQGCRAEHAVLDFEGSRWHTIAIEDVDPDRVLSAVASLELGLLINTSYPAALKAACTAPAR
jgi:hypothetical protein